jgi:hypothetical protein
MTTTPRMRCLGPRTTARRCRARSLHGHRHDGRRGRAWRRGAGGVRGQDEAVAARVVARGPAVEAGAGHRQRQRRAGFDVTRCKGGHVRVHLRPADERERRLLVLGRPVADGVAGRGVDALLRGELGHDGARWHGEDVRGRRGSTTHSTAATTVAAPSNAALAIVQREVLREESASEIPSWTLRAQPTRDSHNRQKSGTPKQQKGNNGNRKNDE